MKIGPLEKFVIKDGWVVPAIDTQCLPWVLNEVPKFDVVLKYVKGRGTLVQAGGNIGVFPVLLHKHFDFVHTFEPDEENFAALLLNTMDCHNVYPCQCALGEKEGDAREVIVDKTNIGAHRMEYGSGRIPVDTIDNLTQSDDVTLIWLDIEGAELIALKGAVETLKDKRPVVVLEMAGHSRRFYGIEESETRNWLKNLGYELVEKTQQDEIFVHKGI